MLPASTETLISQLRLVTGGIFALGMITLLLGIIAFRKSRNESFWRLRRDASRRGMRYVAAAVILLGVSVAFCLITFTVDYVEDPSPQSEAGLPSPTASPSIAPSSETEVPTLTPEAILEGSPSPDVEIENAAQLAAPLPDTSPTAMPTEIVEVQPPTVPPISAVINVVALDDVIGDNLKAIQATTNFDTTVQRLYVFFDYQNMASGMQWKQVLLKDGQVIQERNQQWGITQDSGSSFFFFGNTGGFEAGVYEIRLTAGESDALLASINFTIVPEG
jgi:hypothetical protein